MKTRVKRDFDREDWDRYYRRYQAELARRYLIPILSRWGVAFPGRRFLEVGCGDGGCGAEFHRAGCDVVMVDIDGRLADIAETLNREEAIDARVFAEDILDENARVYGEGPFDLVMFRDVIEHLYQPDRALALVRDSLAPDGLVFVVFPPYYSPYGAHQQILPRKTIGPLPYNKLPYIQLLPGAWFRKLVRGENAANREVERLGGIRLTIRGFERAVRGAGLTVRERRLFLSRPTFALRYGLPVIGAGPLGRLPILNELVVTGAYYLLGRANEWTGSR